MKTFLIFKNLKNVFELLEEVEKVVGADKPAKQPRVMLPTIIHFNSFFFFLTRMF